MNKIKVLALFGESSAGKDSIQHWLCENFDNMHKMISYTTRPPRNYEQDGREYHFLPSADAFFTLFINNKFLEISTFNNWFYGTSINDLDSDKINVGVFNPEGVRSLLKYDDKIEILPVWIQVDDKTRLLRSLKREENPNCEEICRRFLADKKDFSNINFDYEIFLNDKYCDNYYAYSAFC